MVWEVMETHREAEGCCGEGRSDGPRALCRGHRQHPLFHSDFHSVDFSSILGTVDKRSAETWSEQKFLEVHMALVPVAFPF